jgi:hypothetical protein
MASVIDDGNGTGGDTTTTTTNRGTGKDFYKDLNRGTDLYRELSYGEDPGFEGGDGLVFNDPSTGLAITKGYFIEIHHIISGKDIFFKAFLTDFSDNFTTNYNKEQVFGRPDPIQTYQNTERVMNVAFDLVSTNINEARQNLIKANNLISMMYPSYDSAGTANTIKSGPLFKVKMGNLICKPGLTEADGTAPASTAGLSCTIGGFKYDPIIDDGFFDPEPGIFYPQTIKIDLELSILHEEALGFQDNVPLTNKEVNATTNEVTNKPSFPYAGDPALSLNGGTGDVRQDLPNTITQGNSVRGGPLVTDANRDGIRAELVENGKVTGNVYVYQDDDGNSLREPREGERRGIRSMARLEQRVMSERARVQANKILSPRTRSQIGSALGSPYKTYTDFITDGYFPE